MSARKKEIMCTSGTVINGTTKTYVDTCGELASTLNCHVADLVVNEHYNPPLKAHQCLCGCDVEASGIKFSFHPVEDGDIDFVLEKRATNE